MVVSVDFQALLYGAHGFTLRRGGVAMSILSDWLAGNQLFVKSRIIGLIIRSSVRRIDIWPHNIG